MPLIRLFYLFIILCWQPANAHKVLTLIYATGLEITGQIAYSSGEFAKEGGAVAVFRDGQPITTVNIQAQGSFTYKAPNVANYRFVADLGNGHIAELTVDASELSAQSLPKQSREAMPSLTDSELIMQTVDKTLAQQLLPLRQEIQALREKQRLVDILAAMGIIIGIFGAIAWMRGRKPCRDRHATNTDS